MTTPSVREAARALLDEFTYSERDGNRLMIPGYASRVNDAALALRTAIDADDGEYERVAKIRAYATDSAAVCRKAEEARRSDLSKRENGTIADMLREQTFAWGAKAKSYDALVEFIDSLYALTPKPVAPKPASERCE